MDKLLANSRSQVVGLSKEQVNSLKGIFAVIVLIHHLYQSTAIVGNRYLGAILQAFGFFAVSVFFFLSGYGLQVSYCIKKETYIKPFFKEKIIPFYCIIMLLIAIYLPARILMGEIITPLNVFRSFLFGSTIVSKGWYLQAQLFLYLLFFFIWHFIKNDTAKQIILFTVVSAHIALCVCFDVAITRYISLLAFNFGIFWADKREVVFAKLENKKVYVLSFATCFGIMGATFGIWHFTNGAISILSQGICQLFFVVLVILMAQKIKFVTPVTRHLGVYSLEIYIIQGLFLNIYKSSLIYIENDYFFTGAVVVSTYLTALIIHPVIKFIYLVFSRKKVKK